MLALTLRCVHDIRCGSTIVKRARSGRLTTYALPGRHRTGAAIYGARGGRLWALISKRHSINGTLAAHMGL
jgi:hypothetical protein